MRILVISGSLRPHSRLARAGATRPAHVGGTRCRVGVDRSEGNGCAHVRWHAGEQGGRRDAPERGDQSRGVSVLCRRPGEWTNWQRRLSGWQGLQRSERRLQLFSEGYTSGRRGLEHDVDVFDGATAGLSTALSRNRDHVARSAGVGFTSDRTVDGFQLQASLSQKSTHLSRSVPSLR